MADFESELLRTSDLHCDQLFAWVVLPNHYHVLVHTLDVEGLLRAIGRLHGSSSFRWNGQDGCRGRQVWHRAAETAIRSEGHFWATFNYVMNNAVHHGYVARWQDWPYSNAADYLQEIGRGEVERRWRQYPVLDYGKDWDPSEL